MQRMTEGPTNMNTATRIEWEEQRCTSRRVVDLFFVIAEKLHGKWRLFERSSWDLTWVEVPVTAARLAELDAELVEHTDSAEESQHKMQTTGLGPKRDSVLGATPRACGYLLDLCNFRYSVSSNRRVPLLPTNAHRPRDSPLDHKVGQVRSRARNTTLTKRAALWWTDLRSGSRVHGASS